MSKLYLIEPDQLVDPGFRRRAVVGGARVVSGAEKNAKYVRSNAKYVRSNALPPQLNGALPPQLNTGGSGGQRPPVKNENF